LALAFASMMLAAIGAAPEVRAHDPSAYGGLFRSRDLGASWLNADIGLFVNAALTVAPDPRDADHLLFGTDTGLLQSRNGGRSWQAEASSLILGPVFAVAFAPGGDSAICAAPSGVFVRRGGEWRRAAVADGAAPARAIAFGAAADRVYLAGERGLFLSEDGGASFARVADLAPITALAVAIAPRELLLAVSDGRLMASADGGTSWQPRPVAGAAPVDTVALDPAATSRVWAASADRLYVSDDLGVAWRPAGARLPEAQTSVRGIAADAAAATLVVTSHRGMYRSADGGASWTLKEGNLPIHLEAGPLIRNGNDPQTLYAVYSLMPYPVVWRTALEGGSLLARVDRLSLAGGLAFLALLVFGGGYAILWLERRRARWTSPRGSAP
jgi:photosystem II stability/assembly factor-like uncharacterized protein